MFRIPAQTLALSQKGGVIHLKKTQEKSNTYEICRYVTPSSLLASQTSAPGAKARKKTLHKSLTYEQLFEALSRQASLQEVKPQTAANRASILRTFMRVHSLHEHDVVGAELRANFSVALNELVVSLQDGGRATRDVTNTASAMRRVHEMVLAADRVAAASQEQLAPFTKAVRAIVADHPVRRVARQAGVPADMLFGWLKGKQPRPSSSKYLSRLESFFGIEKGGLARLAGIHGITRIGKQIGVAPPNDYRERLAKQSQSRFFFIPKPDSPLREQWVALLRYKTAAVASGLERGPGGRWTFSPVPAKQHRDSNWYTFLDGVEVPSANVNWNHVAGFLGFLSLPHSDGGKSISASELNTLAWFALPDWIEDYLLWRKARSGGSHSRHILTFLGLVIWLTRPGDGYLYQLPEMLDTLPERFRRGTWQDICKHQNEYCLKLRNALAAEAVTVRDPFAPVRPMLDQDQPLDAVADMVARMRKDRPSGGAASLEAIWARNIFLVKLLASNPLRLRNIACLVWEPSFVDGQHRYDQPCLYKKTDGSWWIFISRTLLKNRRGTRAIKDYDSPVHESVWRDLERYLFKHRPVLMCSPTNLVFLTRKKDSSRPHVPWMDMVHAMNELTKRYLWKCDGVGPHAFRHIVATSILKAPMGTTKTAALVLNDKESTVEAAYSGLVSKDGNERMFELLEATYRRMG